MSAGGSRELMRHAAGQHLDKALADCAKAVALKPGLSTVWYERGNVYFALGQHDRAIADFSKAIELEPSFAWAWGNRGSARASRGDRAGAVADWSRTIEARS